MARVELELTPLPAHVRTARLVVVAAARRAGLDDALLDELRLAVGEAVSRAVGLHRTHTEGTPVLLSVTDEPGALTVTVADRGPSAGPAPADLVEGLLGHPDGDEADTVDPDVALAVLSGLVDDLTVEASPGGTTVTLRWPLQHGNGPVGVRSTAAAP